MRVDEKYLEQASALTDDLRDDSLAAIKRAMQGPGQEDCEDCGEAIPPARLQAAPYAVRCVLCQAQFEHRKKANPLDPWSTR